VLNKHDITHVIARRLITHERGTARRLYAETEARKLRTWEARACRTATAVLACSEHDRQILKELAPNARIAVAPNVIDVEAYRPAGPIESTTMLYVGSMDWLPNRDAVELFASTILPRVRARVPNAEFHVVGRAASSTFRRRLEGVPGVVFVGAVDNIQDAYREAAVCVVPLRIGSGTRLKILEAGAMAKAIVSTTVGAEGLTLRPGSEILIEDDPTAFASEVIRCLENRPLRDALGSAARRYVNEHYSFGALRAQVDAALSEFFPSATGRAREAAATGTRSA
jgi:glycosyltransferase involved in cell wall biosynthesis